MVWPYYIAFVLSRIDGFDRALILIRIYAIMITKIVLKHLTNFYEICRKLELKTMEQNFCLICMHL